MTCDFIKNDGLSKRSECIGGGGGRGEDIFGNSESMTVVSQRVGVLSLFVHKVAQSTVLRARVKFVLGRHVHELAFL